MRKRKKRAKPIRLRIHVILIILLVILLLFIPFSIVIESMIRERDLLNTHSSSSFSIVVLPDTQFCSEKYPVIFMNQTKWITENKEKFNIQMVIHEGDIVNDNKQKQWDNANQSLSVLEQYNIPYSIIPGNHDSDEKTNYSYYDIYFPLKRFQNQSWYGGSFDNYRNNYQLLYINNRSFIFINLNFCPGKKEIEWANQVLNNYSDRKAILTTHGYLKDNEPPDRFVHFCGSTENIWNELIKLHPNLQLVLSGHSHSEKRRIDNNMAGKPVYQILADYQDENLGGSGYLRILEWDLDDNIINVRTYSPYLNRYKKGYESEFSLKL